MVRSLEDHPTSTARSTRLAGLLLGVAGLLTLAFFHYFAEQRGDDSFIFYRIADHLRAGQGPVFNVGERVEVYSSPLWLLLLAVGRSCLEYVTLGRWLGFASTAATAVLTFRLARTLGASRPMAAASVLALCASGSLFYWTPSGLETPLYTALFVWTCVGMLREPGREWALALALLGITRPEGFILAGVSVVLVAVAERRLPPWRWLIVALGVPAFYIAFRLAYFGWLFPNTYYAKATGALGKRLVDGLDYAFWPTLALALVVAAQVRGFSSIQERRRLAVLTFTAALLGAVVVGGGDWMWGRRLLLPVVPVIGALAAAWISSFRRFRGPAFAAFTLLLGFDDLPSPDRKDYERFFHLDSVDASFAEPRRALQLRFGRPLETLAAALRGQRMPEGSRIEGTMTVVSADVARYLRERYPADTLVGVNHAGALPFHATMPVVDMTGLGDEHIAHMKGAGGVHEKFDVEYVLARSPDLFVLNSRIRPTDELWYAPGYWVGESALVEHPAFKRHYRPLPEFWSWQYADGFTSYIVVYERVP